MYAIFSIKTTSQSAFLFLDAQDAMTKSVLSEERGWSWPLAFQQLIASSGIMEVKMIQIH